VRRWLRSRPEVLAGVGAPVVSYQTWNVGIDAAAAKEWPRSSALPVVYEAAVGTLPFPLVGLLRGGGTRRIRTPPINMRAADYYAYGHALASAR
jgi:hypothetical protein